MSADVRGRRFRFASPATAVALGALTLALVTLYVPLAHLTHQLTVSQVTPNVGILALPILGVVVARRQPANPIGWILVALGAGFVFYSDAGRYSVLDYHFHHGDLPLGPAAALVASELWVGFFLALPLVILLFPDGRLSRRWRKVLWAYLVVAALLVAFFFGPAAWGMVGHRISVDNDGQMINSPSPSGVAGTVLEAAGVALVISLPLFWLSFVARQVVSWRHSAGERRQQLKWLMGGSAISVVGLVGVFVAGNSAGPIAGALLPIAFFAVLALPISISVGILKYRLFEIDRLISRTLSYTIVTGLVVGLYVGIVTLTTKAFGFSSPVAVAASTLAAAAVFNPLRHRVQRLVDRRFNRARYDAEATVAGFTARLRDAVDLETVRSELLEVVNRAVEPAHASVWIRQYGPD